MSKIVVTSTDDQKAGLGVQLRQRRRVKAMTLSALSQQSGMSVGLLSQIERGLSSPSLKSLTRICAALGIPLSWLFDNGPAADPAEKGLVVRRGSRRRLDLGSFGVTKELLSPDLGGEMQIYLVSIQPGGQSGPETYTHRGEEGGLVLSGSLELTVDGRIVVLYEGDSFRFSSALPHRFSNPGTTRTNVVWANSLAFY
ncbi:MAG TPA: cupin domain-containing protein [Burkholderiaceae bacterium]